MKTRGVKEMEDIKSFWEELTDIEFEIYKEHTWVQQIVADMYSVKATRGFLQGGYDEVEFSIIVEGRELQGSVFRTDKGWYIKVGKKEIKIPSEKEAKKILNHIFGIGYFGNVTVVVPKLLYVVYQRTGAD